MDTDLDLLSTRVERLGMSRREFLKWTGIGALGFSLASLGLSGCTQEQLEEFLEKIKNRPVRRNISSLDSNDPVLKSYRDAITAMKALPSSDRRNWEKQAQIHFDFCPHRNWLWLPWHRAYLWHFEEICRELSGNNDFALPYWDWTANPQIPSVFFVSGDPLFNGTRTATSSSTPNVNITGASNINSIMAETNFLNFASGPIPGTGSQRATNYYSPLESGPHNHIHPFVGGDMGGFHSPRDPIFWTHHNRLEQLWVEWNITKGNPNTNDTAWTGREFTEFCDRMGNPVTVKVGITLLYPLLSYRFDTQAA